MASKWHYPLNGKKVEGPCSELELRQLAAGGQLKHDDLLGKNRTVRLVRAGDVKGLFNPILN